MPTIAQPFLLTEYYRMCRRTGLQLPKLFQLQLIWEPKDQEWEKVKALFTKPLVKNMDENARESHQEEAKLTGVV